MRLLFILAKFIHCLRDVYELTSGNCDELDGKQCMLCWPIICFLDEKQFLTRSLRATTALLETDRHVILTKQFDHLFYLH